MRVLSIVLSVFVLGGAALWTYLTVTEEERSAIEVHLEEGKTETVSFENLCLIPGERCEYELALDGGRAKQYKVAFDFVEIKEGTLKNYACARIESKTGVLYDGLLAPLLEENGTLKVSVDFEEEVNTDLKIIYYLPIEVGNEAQNAEALFELHLTASNK